MKTPTPAVHYEALLHVLYRRQAIATPRVRPPYNRSGNAVNAEYRGLLGVGIRAVTNELRNPRFG